ncbi:S-adenosyl-L-methionine-dependent methyltransferase [Piptocephalis cylindrospora]|uniref:catechol O-methyltransferase n=1 Tax=Piptocephalis cylindrospora TaxID=1907219 RepID=A0A4P9Y2A3_9FUNG|nr:S-adenosyl-L-methionine-dependent methyltransferase [Piptocephalis cylindrospora]|eukprot:RKP12957.1 S-adenosyl-L-methionine-dependent methyltransferase [Piptocephalis cylindrospora]
MDSAPDGDPKALLKAVDNLSKEDINVIHVGDIKGQLIDEAIQPLKPKIIVEMGTYIGYSAIRLASEALKMEQDVQIHTYDVNAQMVEIAQKMVNKAGLDSVIHIHHGRFHDLAPELQAILGSENPVDLFLLDHWKPSYVPDTQRLMELGLLRRGSLLIADNCLIPGAPEFVDYIQKAPEWNSKMVKTLYRENLTDEDGVIFAAYRG